MKDFTSVCELVEIKNLPLFSMFKKSSFVGIDLHSDKFSAYYLHHNHKDDYRIFTFDDEGIADFLLSIKKQDILAVEATANAAFFTKKIRPHVKDLRVVAPSEFGVISKSLKKTDKNDAKTLATFLSRDLLPKARIKEEIHSQILSLVEMRNTLVKQKAVMANKTHSLMLRNGIKLEKSKLRHGRFDRYVFIHEYNEITQFELEIIAEQFRFKKEAIKRIEKRISELANNLKFFQNVNSIRGFGDVSTATILAIIGDIDDFPSPSKLASYFGIVPKVRESNGKRESSGITRKGSKSGRVVLVHATWIAIRYNDYLKEFYEKLKARKGSQVAIVATARKLLTIVYYAMKKNMVYTNFDNNEYYIADDR